jgi:hypothetical protein
MFTIPTLNASGPTTILHPLGSLMKVLDEAKTRGWTVVSMKDDWKTIFPQ